MRFEESQRCVSEMMADLGAGWYDASRGLSDAETSWTAEVRHDAVPGVRVQDCGDDCPGVRYAATWTADEEGYDLREWGEAPGGALELLLQSVISRSGAWGRMSRCAADAGSALEAALRKKAR